MQTCSGSGEIATADDSAVVHDGAGVHAVAKLASLTLC